MEIIQFREKVRRQYKTGVKITKENWCEDGFIIDSNYEELIRNHRAGLPGISVHVSCPGCRRADQSPVSGINTAQLPAIIPADVDEFDILIRYDGISNFRFTTNPKLRVFLSSNCEGEEPIVRHLEPFTIEMINLYPSPLSIEYDVSHVSSCGETDGAIDLRILGGSGDYKYQWTGADNFTRSERDINLLPAGDYIIYVYDNQTKEELEQSISITEPIETQFKVRNVSAFGAEDGFIEVDVKCGSCNYSYDWTYPDGSKPNNPQANLYNIGSGIYKLIVTDKITGYVKRNEIEIDEPDIIINLVSDDVTYHDGNDGTIRLDVFDSTGNRGTGSYTYNWTGPNSFLSNEKDLFDLYAGTYKVSVKEFNSNKTAYASITIEEPTPDLEISFIVKNVSRFGENDGGISADISGGSGDYEFTWTGPSINTNNQRQKNIQNLSKGRYTISIYDRVTCKTTNNSVTVMEPDSDLEIETRGKNPSKWGFNDGSIVTAIKNGEAPYRFQWTGPGIGITPGSEGDKQNPTNLIAGTYEVTVFDFNNNRAKATVVLEQPGMKISWDVTHVDTCGENARTGQIDMMVSGGVGPYRFQWSGPGIDADNVNASRLEMIPSGIYVVQITDEGTGEITERTILVREPSPDLSIRFQVKNISSPGGADGAITAIIEGAKGTENFSYEWRYSEDPNWVYHEEAIIGTDIPLDAPDNYTPLQVRSGTYTLKVTAQNNLSPEVGYTDDGPVLTNSVTLTEPDPICCIGGLEISLDKTPMTGFGRNDCELRVQFITAPKRPVSYKWMKDGKPFIDMEDNRDGVLTGLGAGTYTVTVTDADGRTATATDSCDCFIDPCKNQRYARLGETEGNKVPDLVAFNLSPISFSIPESLNTDEYSPEYIASISHNIAQDYFEGENNTVEIELPVNRGACCCGMVQISYEHTIGGMKVNGINAKKGTFQAEVDESNADISKIVIPIEPPEVNTITDDEINICGCLHLTATVICDKFAEFPTYETISIPTINVCLSNGDMTDLLPGLLSSNISIE